MPPYNSSIMPPAVALTADRTSVRLSDAVLVTLTADGPAPLRVELQREVLSPEAAAVWKIEPVGPAVITDRDGGTARWEQTFRLSPFVPGDAVPLAFNPVRVADTSLTPNPLAVAVETSLGRADANDARPVTEIEQLPAAAADGPAFVLAAMAAVVIGFVGAVVVALLRRRRVPPPVSALELATRRLETLEVDRRVNRISAVQFVDGVSDVLRGDLSRRFGLPADKLTTAEILAAGDRATGWPPDTRAAVGDVLDRCDRVKFAGHVPSLDECDRLSADVRQLVANPPPS